MQPSRITITEKAVTSLKCYGVVANTPYDTRLQNREPGDKSKIAYILNPNHIPTDRNSNQFIALTQHEYNVVEFQ